MPRRSSRRLPLCFSGRNRGPSVIRARPHQMRLRVHAAGVNFADSLMVGGTYQVEPPFPFTPGLEAAGEIVETGSAVDGLRVGQRALAVLRNGGGYAEEIALDAAAVVPIPTIIAMHARIARGAIDSSRRSWPRQGAGDMTRQPVCRVEQRC
jgi:hypothetical protein